MQNLKRSCRSAWYKPAMSASSNVQLGAVKECPATTGVVPRYLGTSQSSPLSAVVPSTSLPLPTALLPARWREADFTHCLHPLGGEWWLGCEVGLEWGRGNRACRSWDFSHLPVGRFSGSGNFPSQREADPREAFLPLAGTVVWGWGGKLRVGTARCCDSMSVWSR